MNIVELLAWQWEGYGKYHRSRTNLIIHIIAIPIFVFSVLSAIYSLLTLSLLGFIYSMTSALIAFGAQGFGHSKEELPAEPFTGPKQAVMRILLEQFITFPKFVLTGGWYAAFTSNNRKS